jgi:hypothetical protein
MPVMVGHSHLNQDTNAFINHSNLKRQYLNAISGAPVNYNLVEVRNTFKKLANE